MKPTKPSFESCALHDAPSDGLTGLVLPDGDSFRSLPPQTSLATMIVRSRELRKWFPQSIPTAAERWAAKTDVEFIL
jgi:hypothetical protein